MRETELDRRMHMAAQRLRDHAELRLVPPLPRRARAGTRRLSPAMAQVLAVVASIAVVVAVVFGGRFLVSGKQSQPALTVTHPVAVAYGLGAVWIADNADNQLVEVDLAGLTVRKRITIGPDPVDVTVAGDSVWVLCRGDSSLRRYNPQTGTTGRVAASLDSVALGATGTSLLVLSAGNQTLELRDGADGHPVRAVVLDKGLRQFAANTVSAVFAADGDLMAAELTDMQPHRLATLPVNVTALALTDAGTVVAATDDSRLSVVDPDGQIRSSVTLPGRPTALAVRGRTLWASTVDGSLAQLRLVGTALTVIHITQLGTALTDLATADDGSALAIAEQPPFLIREQEQP